MPYQANVFKVMIASPSDVEQERQIARQVIHDWNDLHSEKTKIVLLPVGWETHSSPEMGNRAQEIINKQVLENADLLIGIFWTRLGTPTGKSQSGTVEEIEEHIKVKKPVMLYFSNQPVLPNSIDPEQYNKLMDFKKSCKDRGLVNEYTTLIEFKDNLRKHLIIKVNESSYFNIEQKINNDDKLNAVCNDNQYVTNINLSEEAKQLLVETSKDNHGQILKVRTSGGTIIQTNGKNMIPSPKEPRIIAKWEYALKELLENDFIEERGQRGEVFAITSKGYEYVDRLKMEIEITGNSLVENNAASTQKNGLEFEVRTGTYISPQKGIRYCGKCLDSSSKKVPLTARDNGWSCNVCDKFYLNPNYNPPIDSNYDLLT